MGMTKEQEQAAVRDLVRLLPLPDVTGLAPREEPDIELTMADRQKVGLEVTELVVEPQAAGKAAADRLCRDLEAALTARGVTAGVIVSFRSLYGAVAGQSGERRKQLVDELVKLVVGDLPIRDHLTHETDEFERIGIHEVQWMMVIERDDKAIAGSTSHGIGPRHDHVQAGIDKKKGKLESYRGNMPGAPQWLLLVTGFRTASGVWCAVLEGREYVSGFDRVFCMDYYDGKAFEVRSLTSCR